MRVSFVKIMVLGLAAFILFLQHGDNKMVYNKLTSEEEHVIIHKGTELTSLFSAGNFSQNGDNENGYVSCPRSSTG